MFMNYYQTRPRSPTIWICVQLPWLRAFGQFAAQTRLFRVTRILEILSLPGPHQSTPLPLGTDPAWQQPTPLTKRALTWQLCGWAGPKLVRPHKWGFWVIIRFLGFWGPKVCEFRHYSPSKQSNTWIIWKTPKERHPPQRGRVSKPEVEFFAASHYLTRICWPHNMKSNWRDLSGCPCDAAVGRIRSPHGRVAFVTLALTRTSGVTTRLWSPQTSGASVHGGRLSVYVPLFVCFWISDQAFGCSFSVRNNEHVLEKRGSHDFPWYDVRWPGLDRTFLDSLRTNWSYTS